MYPLLVLTTAQRTSAQVADKVIGLQAAASSIGNAIAPGLVGLAIASQPHTFGWATAGLSATAAILVLVIHHRSHIHPSTTTRAR
ncbi:MAG TPA: hypothetical protein VHO26_07365 [Propionibacteriaceae bacterium]|nr:hypothetical protein [Propionibacteriaceae bacterium]